MKFKNFYSSLIITSILNSISQIMLIEKPLVGLSFLIGISFSSLTSSFALLLGATVGSLIGRYYFNDPVNTHQGLYGYNSALSALAITIFSDTSLWIIYSLVSASMTVYFQYLITPWFKKRKLPILTFPFIVISLGWLLVFHYFNGDNALQNILTHSQNVTTLLAYSFTLSFSQIFFSDNYISGTIIILSILLTKRELFIQTFCTLLFCGAIWYLFNNDLSFFTYGLFGYNPVLVGIALATFLPTFRFWKVIPLACILCVFLQIILTKLLAIWQLPILTSPFVLTTWFILWVSNFYNLKNQ